MTEVYATLQQLEEESFPVSLLCQCLSVSRSAYYAWREDGIGVRKREDNRLRPVTRRLWVGDITYVPLLGGDFLYLAKLMDRFSRRIVGWDLQDHMRESLVLAALRAAIALRRPRPGLIHHTDRGGQYAGAEYRRMLARAGMPQSMSRAENCYDNVFMESCFGTIKTELEMEPYALRHQSWNALVVGRRIGLQRTE